jgi:hypothetical protein
VSPEYAPHLFATLAIMAGALLARALRRISETTTYGVMALSQVVSCLGGFVAGNTVAASISGAGAGYLAWQWRNGGGGDGTRRRLRKWGRRFRGVRRTAPAGA